MCLKCGGDCSIVNGLAIGSAVATKWPTCFRAARAYLAARLQKSGAADGLLCLPGSDVPLAQRFGGAAKFGVRLVWRSL